MQGAPLYIFDKNDNTIKEASVVSVSLPHYSKAAASNPMGVFQTPVVEITYSLGGENATLEFPVNSLLAEYPAKGWFVSIDKNVVSREIDAEADRAQQQLALVPKYKKIVEEREALQGALFPERGGKPSEDLDLLRSEVSELKELLRASLGHKTKEK